MDKYQIAVVVGSPRHDSFNRKLASAVAKFQATKPGGIEPITVWSTYPQSRSTLHNPLPGQNSIGTAGHISFGANSLDVWFVASQIY